MFPIFLYIEIKKIIEIEVILRKKTEENASSINALLQEKDGTKQIKKFIII